MVKRKSGQAASGVAAAVAGAAPKGFTVVELNLPGVKWEEVSEVTGVVVDSDLFINEKGAKRVLVVDIEGQHTRLYEQGGLGRFFDKVMVGDTIWVKTTGKVKHGATKTLRKFEAAMIPGTERKPIVVVPPELRAKRPAMVVDVDGVIEE